MGQILAYRALRSCFSSMGESSGYVHINTRPTKLKSHYKVIDSMSISLDPRLGDHLTFESKVEGIHPRG